MRTFEIQDLCVEYVENPLGLDVKEPRFSWKMRADCRGAAQSAYQIRVSNSRNGELVWDSSKVSGRKSVGIIYQGELLQPCTRYNWTLTVWNEEDSAVEKQSWFETGLMNASLLAWEGAAFIGPEELSLEASSLGIYRLDASFRIVEKEDRTGGRGGIVFGGNDLRLLDRAKNTLGMEGANYFSYMIDVSAIPAKLEIYRVGYAPEDREDVPLASLDIRAFEEPENLIITEENRYQTHTLSIEVYGNLAKAWIDGCLVDQIKDESFLAKRFNLNQYVGRQLNPVGENDCPTYPRLCQVGFAAEAGTAIAAQKLEISNVRTPGALLQRITAENADEIFADVTDLFVVEKEEIVLEGSAVRCVVMGDPSHGSIPMVRREFEVSNEKKLASARLYATARGIYEGHVNGNLITEDLLNPGASQFDKHLYYQTYDITSRLQPGRNGIGFYLGSGWWSDAQTFSLMNYNYFGDRPSLLAKIVLEYEDGSIQTMVTDTVNWQCSIEGPVRYAGFFHGEHYDARREAEYEAFSTAGYQGGSWGRPAHVPVYQFEPTAGPFQMWPSPNETDPELIGQPGDRVRHGEVKPALERTEPAPGVYIYDMGQNMAGVPRLRLHGSKGQKAVIRYGETLYPKLDEYDGLEGFMLTENLRDAANTDIYICKGEEEEVYMPRFTFHGYRYIEVSGLDQAPALADVESVSISSIAEFTGAVETSNPMLNKLFENISWSQRSNFISIPTDCPQRNERMGWMGDAQVFAKTASYNANVLAFFQRYLVAVRDLQQESGKYPDIAPVGGGFGGIVWESAGIIIPWEMYQQYGDTRIVEENYEAMKKYLAYLKDIFDHEKFRQMHFLGDWLAADMSTDENLIWLCHYAYDVKLVAKMAEVIGAAQDAAGYWELYKDLQQKFNETYFDAQSGRTVNETGEVNDTQCSYALPLAYGILNEANQEAAGRRLHEKTVELGHTLTTGFIGTGLINPALTDSGYAATAYQLVQQTQYPSWLYSITQGATSIWERWNSFTFENGFGGNNSMNSFNHYSLGAIGSWMYSHMLGIQRLEEEPGFGRFKIRPYMMGVEYAKGYYDSMYGRISSSWSVDAGQVKLDIEIPANTTAVLYLPKDAKLVDEHGKTAIELDQGEGLRVMKEEDGCVVAEAVSGAYTFVSLG